MDAVKCLKKQDSYQTLEEWMGADPKLQKEATKVPGMDDPHPLRGIVPAGCLRDDGVTIMVDMKDSGDATAGPYRPPSKKLWLSAWRSAKIKKAPTR